MKIVSILGENFSARKPNGLIRSNWIQRTEASLAADNQSLTHIRWDPDVYFSFDIALPCHRINFHNYNGCSVKIFWSDLAWLLNWGSKTIGDKCHRKTDIYKTRHAILCGSSICHIFQTRYEWDLKNQIESIEHIKLPVS